ERGGEGSGGGRGARKAERAAPPARPPRRIGGADQRADRGAGDGGGLLAHVVERFEHRDMREPARAAAAERKGEALRHRAPASHANSQALTASAPTTPPIPPALSLLAL